MNKTQKKKWRRVAAAALCIGILMECGLPVARDTDSRILAQAAVTDSQRAVIESCLYNAEYYEKANDDVAVALNYDKDAMYQHWLNYGMAEGRNASMVFNAKYYLEVNPDVAAVVGANNYEGAYEHFVTSGLLEGRESSPVFSVKYYLQANTDVAQAFNGDYISAAKHFNENAIAEGRSGSGNFDYTVYRACNTDVEELYGDYTEGYYIHYINHGRAEGRTGGLAAGGSGNSGIGGGSAGGGTAGDSTGETAGIDTTAPSYRIFDAEFYLEKYPALANSVGIDADTLYLYWISDGIALGQTASPVIVPEEYLELNSDVAEVFGDDYAAAIRHFLNDGILEGRTGSNEFDYSIYAACNTDVGGVFADDIVGYYFHYVKYGKAENRTAAVYVPEQKPEEMLVNEVFAGGLAITPYHNNGNGYSNWWNESEICAYVEGITAELDKGIYGVTVYVPDGALKDGTYGLGVSLSEIKSPYAYFDYVDCEFSIAGGTLDEDKTFCEYKKVSDGYLIYLSNAYVMKETVDDIVLILKLHSGTTGENGSLYFGDFFVLDEVSGGHYYNLCEEELTFSAERLATEEEITVQTACLNDVGIIGVTKNLTVGESCTIEFTKDKENVVFSSSAEEVAVVDAKGVIKALAEGTTKIMVRDVEKDSVYTWNLVVSGVYNAPENAGNKGMFSESLQIYPYDNNNQTYENWWSESEICVYVENVPVKLDRGGFSYEVFVPYGMLEDGEYALELFIYSDTGTGYQEEGGRFDKFYVKDGSIDTSRYYCEYVEVPMGYILRFYCVYAAKETVENCRLVYKLHSESPEKNGAIYIGNQFFGDVTYGAELLEWNKVENSISAVRISTNEEEDVTVKKLFTDVESPVRKLHIGESATVKISAENSEDLDFFCSDYAIAVVDKQGVVTAMSRGTVELTVKSETGTEISWLFTVLDAEVGLEFEKNSILLGDTYQFVGKGYGVKNPVFTWTSSDTSVGTIDSNGLFTALKAGNTEITLKDTRSKKSYTFTVTVYTVSNSDLAEYISIETNGLISSELEQKITELLYTVYPNVFDYFADGEYNKVTCNFQKMDGVAYTVGRDMYISSDYINSNPNDVDCITHELIHCAQYYPGGAVWLVEGITDYGRSLFGVYNDEANWSLATYQEGQNYTDSYGVTGGFLKYVVDNHNSNIVRILNTQLKNGDIEESVWKDSTGYTIDELWEKYAAQ